jgi:colanic acid biosynthesis glycosyl transferase WcaI
MAGIRVLRIATLPILRKIPLIRGLEHFLLGLQFFLVGLFAGEQDAILAYSPPLPLGVAASILGRIKGCPSVVNIQDLYPQTVIDLKLLKNRFLIKVSRKMEAMVYEKADGLAVHSEENRDYIIGRGIPASKIAVIENWVDLDLIRPSEKSNEFRRKHGLGNKYVVSFAGVMGFAQGLENVVEAAKRLKNREDLLFLLIGDGVMRRELEERAKGLKNVRFLPPQPRDIYPQVLCASDACLVSLSGDVPPPVVPAKLMSIMAAGRPVIASLPGGAARKVVQDSSSGLCAQPGDAETLTEIILRLYNDKPLSEKLGENGRRYAEERFCREANVAQYEELFKKLMGGV